MQPGPGHAVPPQHQPERRFGDDEFSLLDEDPEKPGNAKRNWGIGALVTLTVLMIALLYVDFDGVFDQIDATMPADAGHQTREVEGVTFYSFDSDTDLMSVVIQTKRRFSGHRTKFEPMEDTDLFFISGNQRVWVFAYQGSGPSWAMQGVAAEQTGNVSGFIARCCSPSAIKHQPRQEAKSPEDMSIDRHMTKAEWTSQQYFLLSSPSAEIYIATVEHPTDEASTARARAFIDKAIKQPRTIHHARGITALMRAVGDPKPEWMEWLKDRSSWSVDEMKRESDPLFDDEMFSFLEAQAEQALDDLAATYLVLTEFKDVIPVIDKLTRINQVGGMILSYGMGRSLEADAATLKERIHDIALVTGQPQLTVFTRRLWAAVDIEAMLADTEAWEARDPVHEKWGHAFAALDALSPEGILARRDLIEKYLLDVNTPTYQRYRLTELLIRADADRAFEITLDLIEKHKDDYPTVQKISLDIVHQGLVNSTQPNFKYPHDWKPVLRRNHERMRKLLLENGPVWQRAWIASLSRTTHRRWVYEADRLKTFLWTIGDKDLGDLSKRMSEATDAGLK